MIKEEEAIQQQKKKEEEAVLWSDFLGFILTKIKKKSMERERKLVRYGQICGFHTFFLIFIKFLLNNVIGNWNLIREVF